MISRWIGYKLQQTQKKDSPTPTFIITIQSIFINTIVTYLSSAMPLYEWMLAFCQVDPNFSEFSIKPEQKIQWDWNHHWNLPDICWGHSYTRWYLGNYRKTSGISCTKSQNLNVTHFISSCSCPIHWNQVLTLNVRGPSYLGLTRSISWLLMPWLTSSSGHQQPWYWLYRISRSFSCLRKDFKYFCYINVEKWHKM